jgi:hypothetical protein
MMPISINIMSSGEDATEDQISSVSNYVVQ